MMRIAILTALVAFFFGTNLCGQSEQTEQNTTDYIQNNIPTIVRVPTFTDSELIERLQKMTNKVVSPRFDNVVRSYINTYTVKNRQKAEAMLGRTVMYFPIFEKYLEETNLPMDLRYLSVVESALDPTATSRSGAAGLWQFMPGTGKDFGLRITSLEDQRRDPHKSTEAALKYLERLYNRFGSWELALAAYNGGPGRVNRAIKRGHSENFWTIRQYLPVETRNYVPAFIAATYIMNYYDLHNLYPQYPEKELQVTHNTMVYQQISFQEIADVTGTSMDVIAKLNPSYLRGIIPSNMNGASLILPIASLAIFENFLGRPDSRRNGMISSSIPAPTASAHNPAYFKTSYLVKSGDHLSHLAEMFKCSEKDIIQWNQLKSAQLQPQQKLVLYLPKENTALMTPLISIPRIQLRMLEAQPAAHELKTVEPISFNSQNRQFNRPGKKDKYIFYQVRRRETLAEIAAKFPGVSPQDILSINQLSDGESLKPGKRIKIRER